jgi:hypothetical protein
MPTRPHHSYFLLLRRLDAVAQWALWASRVLLVIALLITILAPASTAFAQGTNPDDPVNGAAGRMVGILATLGKLFIQVAYALMFLVFAVGSVKSGLGAQVAQQFGATGRVSLEFMNLATGVVIFVVALMTLPLVNLIASQVSEQFTSGGGWDFQITIPVPLPGQ